MLCHRVVGYLPPFRSPQDQDKTRCWRTIPFRSVRNRQTVLDQKKNVVNSAVRHGGDCGGPSLQCPEYFWKISWNVTGSGGLRIRERRRPFAHAGLSFRFSTDPCGPDRVLSASGLRSVATSNN